MKIEVPYIYNLEHTFRCGQAFRWKFENGFWNGITRGEIILIRTVSISKCSSDEPCNELSNASSHETSNEPLNQKTKFEFFTYPKKDNISLIRSYFRLEDNMPEILKSIEKDQIMIDAIKKYAGLHLLRQEPFETLITYLLSIQSSIPIISKNVERLSQEYGKRIECKDYNGLVRYSFPNAEDLKGASENELRSLGLGFRAKWIKNAIDVVNSGKLDFEDLREMNYHEARARLMELKGVGPKIADCVLLFSLDKLEAFPIDRWVKRIMEEEYFDRLNLSDKNLGMKNIRLKELGDFARDYFGKYAGYAQEYLFYYRRTTKSKCKNSKEVIKNKSKKE